MAWCGVDKKSRRNMQTQMLGAVFYSSPRQSMRWLFWGTRGSPYSEGGALYGMGQSLSLQTKFDEFKASCLSTGHSSQVRPDSCEPLRSGYKGAYHGVPLKLFYHVLPLFCDCFGQPHLREVHPHERHDGTPVLRGLPVGAIAQCPGNRGLE